MVSKQVSIYQFEMRAGEPYVCHKCSVIGIGIILAVVFALFPILGLSNMEGLGITCQCFSWRSCHGLQTVVRLATGHEAVFGIGSW